MPLFYGEAVDIVAKENFVFTGLLAVLGAYAGARLLQQVFDELKYFVFARVAQQAIRNFALKVYRHLHALSLSFHLERQTGGVSRVIERGTKSIEFLLTFLLFSIAPTLLEIILVCAIFAVLFGWKISLIAFVMIGGYAVYTIVVTEWRIKFRRQMNDYDKKANAHAVDSLLNYETVKYFNAEDIEAARYNQQMQLYENAAVKNRTSLSLLNIGQGVIIGTGIFIIMSMAGYGVSDGSYSIGLFAAINMYLLQLYLPLNFLGTVYREIRQALTDMEEMFVLLNQPQDIIDKPNAPDISIKHACVRFDDVCFSYGRGLNNTLDKVSFTVEGGEKIAVVGASGAGKSTITRLLYRFYDPSAGRICIDDNDIRDFSQQSVRRLIGVVPQDTVLFNDTLRHNILYGNPQASEKALNEAIRSAEIEDFIASLPEGLNTMVGERGLKLSGGEKQRVSIARVILKQPAIYVFDEATSALDSNTERLVQQSLDAISKSRTTITIAHRLSTIIHADKIIVLDEGKIVEVGTHDSLLEKNERYAALWKYQKKQQDVQLIQASA